MRILVTGGEGLIGRALAVHGGARGAEVVAIGRAECDVTCAEARDATLARYRPDVVIFCAAHTRVDDAGVATAAVNAEAPAEWARRVETWFLSSNFVFSTVGPHVPGEAPRPTSAYAAQKVGAENAVLAAGGHVARVGWVYGEGGRTFASTLRARLIAGQDIPAIFDVLVQPSRADDVAKALLALPRGITHHVGSATVSWYGFALATAAQLGPASRGRIIPVRLAELGLNRPRDARLSPALLPGRRFV